MNAPFQVDTSAVVDVPVWKRPETLDLARGFAWPVGLVLIGMIVLFGMVRPGLRAMVSAKPASLPATGGKFNAVVADTNERPGLPSPLDGPNALPAPSQEVPEQARLEGARQMARNNPVAVANIVKTWVNGDAAGA
jgi:flagellar M-ring protein FliF